MGKSELTTKYDEFIDGLKIINKKHSDYFKKRKASFGEDDPDELGYHYRASKIDGRIRFAINEGSDLREDIKQECLELFKKYT